MDDHEQDRKRVDLGDVPRGEEISEADAAKRAETDPEEQENRRDPVWDEESTED
jgi:hypothetical protein